MIFVYISDGPMDVSTYNGCHLLAYVYFFDDLSDLSETPNNSKRIIAVPVDKLKRFTCEDREELIHTGSSHKGFSHGLEQVLSFSIL